MKELRIVPQINSFDSFAEFAEAFEVESKDLILTNEFIYDPVIKRENLSCSFIFQEKYGTGEPDDIMVEKILSKMHSCNCRRIIAIGGGTVIDIAKIMVLKNAENVDLLFEQKELEKEKELIVIPTTCGTGSEMTDISIINRTRKGTKMGLTSPAMFADHAVLIPEFLKNLPYYIFATSSIDALIHAVESFLSPGCSDYSEMYSRAAINDILGGYCRIAQRGKEERLKDGKIYLRASNFAGIAFGNSGCGAVHAMSYALGGKYHVPHGESNYVFFTEVLRKYYEKMPNGKIRALEKMIFNTARKNNFADTSDNGIDLLEKILAKILECKHMKAYGATQDDVEAFAASTIRNQQRLLKNNYVQLSEEEIQGIYQARL